MRLYHDDSLLDWQACIEKHLLRRKAVLQTDCTASQFDTCQSLDTAQLDEMQLAQLHCARCAQTPRAVRCEYSWKNETSKASALRPKSTAEEAMQRILQTPPMNEAL